ncbi:phosphotransferase [Actinoplanes friuliensis]|uniref:Aminoglycoside phosphotransferase domain-containing protein n=1 Tax=Actinoplanes friuliensis DSM 7358 TaxID=1246995 RepID=U5W253_9ACTN|nr:phosphotransferase [Actinoplanes friuliensis]AGZ43313.1 hypothetical protein AFR_25235 [Actinoplanes friuliensis DSM 7358]
MNRAKLAAAVRFALDGELKDVDRLTGGSRKGVYRLTTADSTTAIAYVWEQAENYWPETEGDDADPFAAGVGFDLFSAARSKLSSLGLRVPAVYLTGPRFALVEDFPGPHLMDLLARDPEVAAPTMSRLAADLAVMRAYRAPAYGKVALIDGGGRSHGTSCESAALDFGLRCLAEAAGRDERIAAARPRLSDRLQELAAAVRPRSEYSVVHGELGLDHVMIAPDGRPVLIDIEDLMYFDVEWEHVFLRIRLGDSYAHLAVDDLDEDRLALYMLVQRLSLTAGPLRLLDGDFPRRAFMQGIAEHNLKQALALLS